jgi:hypothetical protein
VAIVWHAGYPPLLISEKRHALAPAHRVDVDMEDDAWHARAALTALIVLEGLMVLAPKRGHLGPAPEVESRVTHQVFGAPAEERGGMPLALPYAGLRRALRLAN